MPKLFSENPVQSMLKWRKVASLLALGALFACFGEKGVVEPIASAEEALGTITVTPDANIMAVGETRQLTITATSLTGAPLADFDTVVFFSYTPSDSNIISVSPTGLVTAKRQAGLVFLNVFVKRKGQFAGAQVLFQVSQTAITGATLSIQPADSTRLAAGRFKFIPATVRNTSTGTSVNFPVVRLSVKPADVHKVALYKPFLFYGGVVLEFPNNFEPWITDIVALTPETTVWLYGTVDAYGTVLRDSVLFTFTHPISLSLPVSKQVGAIFSPFDSRTITLAAGATVTFRNSVTPASDPLRIAYTFDNPAAATAAANPATVGGSTGNVSALAPSQQSGRRFMTPGTYTWTATASGGPAPWPGQTLSGTIVIK